VLIECPDSAASIVDPDVVPRLASSQAEALAEVSPDVKTRAETMSDGSTATESDGVIGM